MGVKVAKFGGSSVADALQIGKIKNIIYIRRHNNEKSHRKNL